MELHSIKLIKYQLSLLRIIRFSLTAEKSEIRNHSIDKGIRNKTGFKNIFPKE